MITWSRHSRRIDPIERSTYPFCNGDRGAMGRSRNAHCSKPPSERLAIGTVIVTDDKARNSVPGKGFGNLAGQPFRRRIGRDADPYKATASEPPKADFPCTYGARDLGVLDQSRAGRLDCEISSATRRENPSGASE